MATEIFGAVISLRDQFSARLSRAAAETRKFEKAVHSAQKSGRDMSSVFDKHIKVSSGNLGAAMKGATYNTKAFQVAAKKASDATKQATESTKKLASSTVTASKSTGRMARSFNSASLASKGFNRGISVVDRTLGNLYGKAKFFAIGMSIAVPAAFGAAAKSGWKFAADMEVAEMSFTHFTGSVKEGHKQLLYLIKLAKESPFDIQNIQESAQKMYAFGFSTKETNKWLETLTDAISFTGADQVQIDRMILAIGQIRSAGRLQGDELRQLMEARVPVYEILNKEMGLTMDQIRNISDEAIPAEKVLNALMRGMNKMYKDGRSKYARTFYGQWSNLKDSVKIAYAAILDAPFNVVTKKWLGTWVQLASRIQAIFQNGSSFQASMIRSWKTIENNFNGWLNSGGARMIENATRTMGEWAGKFVMGIFGLGQGEGSSSPFVRAGSMALRNFVRGFLGELKAGEILTSPLGRILEGYFLLKFGPNLVKKMSSIAGAELPGNAGKASRILGRLNATPVYVMNRTPIPVVGFGGSGGVDDLLGAGGPGGPKGRLARSVRLAGRIILPIGVGAAIGYELGNWLKDRERQRTEDQQKYQTEQLVKRNDEIEWLKNKKLISDKEHRALHSTSNAATTTDEVASLQAVIKYRELVDKYKKRYRDVNVNGRPDRPGELNPRSSAKERLIDKEIIKTPAKQAKKLKKGVFLEMLGGNDLKVYRAAGGKVSENFGDGIRSGGQRAKAKAAKLARDIVASFSSGGTLTSSISNTASAVFNAGNLLSRANIGIGRSGQSGTGDAPGPMTPFGAGYSTGSTMANQWMAGAQAGAQTAAMPLSGPVASTGSPGGVGGNWAGSKPAIESLYARAGGGLPIKSTKRPNKLTASGHPSDHWVGSTSSYALDLGVKDRSVGDPIAQRLASAVGSSWTPGVWTNANYNGYRYQIGWQTAGHYDHIHIGARKLHGGGVFRAPSQGGEGLALLRDGERVTPKSGANSKSVSNAVSVLVSGNTFVVRQESDIDAIANSIANRLNASLANMAVV